jgi:hypothetical protein
MTLEGVVILNTVKDLVELSQKRSFMAVDTVQAVRLD